MYNIDVYKFKVNKIMNDEIRINRLSMRLLCVCVLLFSCVFSFSAYGQANNLVGTWRFDQVKVKKTVNGVSSEKTYSMKQSFDIFAECPQKITFTADNKIIFEFSDMAPKEGTYSTEGNIIKRLTPEAPYEYKYTITEANVIQLIYSVNYRYNHRDRRQDKITEECTFYGYKE